MPGPRRWREVSPYLDQALVLPEDEHSAWVASVRSRDLEIGDLLQSLLDEHRMLAQEEFLEADQPVMLDLPARAGQKIGAFTLISKIGQGGMGSVWLGERSDGEIQQRVAIKLLSAENHRPMWVARFLRERQLLASLNHASIVHVIDAGHAEDGRPYLVMEYVEGVAIDVYCAGIAIRDRLELFLRVCDGVSHAHRRLIIHRDLKPFNILVDGAGQPKLLDFGIAKLLDETGDPTETIEMLLTPNYASPEQMRGEPQTTATDVYSLGAVLYKLLTDRSPHQSATGMSQAMAAMMGTRNITPPRTVNPAVPRDLDYILERALRAEPEERYASVDAFAKDIQAALDSRPVQARSGSMWYRARKFFRRCWMPVSAATLVLSGLATGLYVANRERAIAQQPFHQVRELAHTFVFDVHDEIAKLQGSTKARQMTVRTGLQYLDSLAKNADGDLELQREIAEAYLKIGDAEGFPTKPNLGRIEDALASYRKAGDLYERIAAKNSAYVPDLARYYLQEAALVRFTHDLWRARRLSESSIQTFDQIREHQSQNAQSERSYLGEWCTLGDIDEDLGRYRQAWKEFSRCGELARALLSRVGGPQELSALAQADERIGTAAQELGFLTEALRAVDEDQSLLDRLLAVEPRNPKLHRLRAVVDHYRSTLYYSDSSPDLGDPARALESAKHYMNQAQEMVLGDPDDTSAQFSLAVATFQVSFCQRESNADAAAVMARNSIRIFDGLIASGKTSYLVTSRRLRAMLRLGEAELKGGRVKEALRTAESTLAGERPFAGRNAAESDEHVVLVCALGLAGQSNAANGNFGRAESLFREAREEAQLIAKDHELQNAIPLANTERVLGAFYTRRHRTEEARICYEHLVELWKTFPEQNAYLDHQRTIAERLLASLHS